MPRIENYDFCGWATKNDLRCQDGRIIRSGAFKVNDGMKVPLVWNHEHNDPSKVLGHAILENRKEGVYAYGFFNNSAGAIDAKESVKNGDVTALSIWANNLEQVGKEVFHGVIREVSLVLAGSNPGAFIESVISHGEPIDDTDDECIIHTGFDLILSHAAPEPEETKKPDGGEKGDKTIKEIYDAFDEDQKTAVAAIVGMAVEEALSEENDEEDEEEKEMKHNVFDNADKERVLSHSDMETIFANAKRAGSLRAAVDDALKDGTLQHSIDATGMEKGSGTNTYGIRDADMLFPEFRAINPTPDFISRDMDWVAEVMSDVNRSPFSRIKSIHADITEDDARARGYIKGKMKKEEFFTLLKRTTAPQTIYKKQKMDRDDIIDITDFDVVAWIRAEMRMMLNEEIARAILIGDGRSTSSDDHIKEDNVRPVVKDVPLYNVIVKVSVPYDATDEDVAAATIKAAIRGRKEYKGSGNPKFWTTEDYVTEMLLLEDKIGNAKYKTMNDLATALRVSKITTVEPMDGTTVSVKESDTVTKTYPLIGTIVNLKDYTVGADRGGAINMFEDFDIDYNQEKYLIETRISGALTKPYSALTLVLDRAAKPTGT